MDKKIELRRDLLAVRRQLDPDLRKSWDEAIGINIWNWYLNNRVDCLGVFWPIKGEPDLRILYNDFIKQGVRLALPVVVAKDLPLQFHSWHPDDHLSKDAMGVPVPADGSPIAPDAILIPCVGFNAQRFRLGYGAGFYDRTLAAASRPVAIGVAYSLAHVVFDAVEHDMPIDLVITELGYL